MPKTLDKRMAAPKKPAAFLSSGFIRMKLKTITSKPERKRQCETYLKRMEVQREAQKKSRSSIEDTDDAIRFLKLEIEHLSGK
ncbi:MAG: hypothetical protein KDC00_00650 [Flavobacteriales bacterium]|nr:hypothetical protein [Flavobacteriales bacterium]